MPDVVIFPAVNANKLQPSFDRIFKPALKGNNTAFATIDIQANQHAATGLQYTSGFKQRHGGDDHAILAARHDLYLRARELNPTRSSGNTRNWAPDGAVTLNPERDPIINTHLATDHIQPLAA